MDEQKIRRIIRDEIARTNQSSRFNLESISNHAHTGTDSSPRIRQEDVIPSTSVVGSIEFSQQTTYTINLNASFTPSNVLAYGVVTGTYNGNAIRALTTGSAQLTPTFYLQPATDTSVVVGGPQYPFPTQQPDGSSPTVPAQSSSYISVSRGSDSDLFAGISEDHIVDLVYPNPSSVDDIRARVTVLGFSRNSIIVSVPYLENGWTIFLNFVIT